MTVARLSRVGRMIRLRKVDYEVPDMSAGILEEIVAGRLRGIPRMNVEQFEQYMQNGLAGENVHCELLDGYPVLKDSSSTGDDPMIMGVRHALVVNALNRRLVLLVSDTGWSTTCQTPVTLNGLNVVEPDHSVIKGSSSDFLPGYPTPDCIILVIEVADSSLEADRIAKAQKYAAVGIVTYWIVNLRQQQLEVYTQPNREHESYSNCQILYGGDEVELNIPALPVHRLSVQRILDGTI